MNTVQDPLQPPPLPNKAGRVARWFEIEFKKAAGFASLCLAIILSATILIRPTLRSGLANSWISLTAPKPNVPGATYQTPPPVLREQPPTPNAPHLLEQPPKTPAAADPKPDNLQQLALERRRRLDELRAKQRAEQEKLQQLKEQEAKDADSRTQQAAAQERLERKKADERAQQALAEQKRVEDTLREAQEAKQAAEDALAIRNREREMAEKSNLETDKIRNYAGPRFGTIQWQGEVHGTTLITIENGHASSGTVVGELPGVPVLIQPVEPKKVGIASSPSERNKYRAMTFRTTGNGQMRLTFQWSLP